VKVRTSDFIIFFPLRAQPHILVPPTPICFKICHFARKIKSKTPIVWAEPPQWTQQRSQLIPNTPEFADVVTCDGDEGFFLS
jgi:hypothetical protein